MNASLLRLVEEFLAETGMSAYTFGLKAAKNGRLVERLRPDRKGGKGRVWPETEHQVRAFIIAERRERDGKKGRAA